MIYDSTVTDAPCSLDVSPLSEAGASLISPPTRLASSSLALLLMSASTYTQMGLYAEVAD